jgi:hypothetical protein
MPSSNYVITPTIFNDESSGWECTCGCGGITKNWLDAEVQAHKHVSQHKNKNEKVSIVFNKT